MTTVTIPQGRMAKPVAPWSSPIAVVRPVMIQRWEDLTFLHRPVPPQSVQRLLPSGLRADTFDEMAWVGLIAFRLTVTMPGLRPLPWASSCPEINVRTYVVGPDGRRGIWFLSLEASRLGAVLAARSWYRLPYMWARMQMARRDGLVQYRAERRWPGPSHPRAAITVALADPVEAESLLPLERFLLARWRMYSRAVDGGLAATTVQHEAWPVLRARVLSLEEDLTAAAGLTLDPGTWVAHYSPGVESRFAHREHVR